jgi:hypothetical protein
MCGFDSTLHTLWHGHHPTAATSSYIPRATALAVRHRANLAFVHVQCDNCKTTQSQYNHIRGLPDFTMLRTISWNED